MKNTSLPIAFFGMILSLLLLGGLSTAEARTSVNYDDPNMAHDPNALMSEAVKCSDVSEVPCLKGAGLVEQAGIRATLAAVLSERETSIADTRELLLPSRMPSSSDAFDSAQ